MNIVPQLGSLTLSWQMLQHPSPNLPNARGMSLGESFKWALGLPGMPSVLHSSLGIFCSFHAGVYQAGRIPPWQMLLLCCLQGPWGSKSTGRHTPLKGSEASPNSSTREHSAGLWLQWPPTKKWSSCQYRTKSFSKFSSDSASFPNTSAQQTNHLYHCPTQGRTHWLLDFWRDQSRIVIHCCYRLWIPRNSSPHPSTSHFPIISEMNLKDMLFCLTVILLTFPSEVTAPKMSWSRWSWGTSFPSFVPERWEKA